MADKAFHWILVIVAVLAGGRVLSFVFSVLFHMVRGARTGTTGAEAARLLLERLGVSDIAVVAVGQTDAASFDAARRQVQLVKAEYEGDRTSALASAAHEVGHVRHALRHPALLAWKTRLLRLTGPVIILTGLLLVTRRLLDSALLAGLGLGGYILTLFLLSLKWVEEIDASRQGLRLLQEADLLPPAELRVAVLRMSLAFGTYLAMMLPFPVIYGMLLFGRP